MSPGGDRPPARGPKPAGRTIALASVLAAGAVAFGLWLGVSGRLPKLGAGDVPRIGRWREAPLRPAPRDGPSAAQAELLKSIGYASGSRPAPSRSGITRHEPGQAEDGVNLVVSGHDAAAYLLDMDGRELHRWSLAFEQVWPDRHGDGDLAGRYWRRVLLLPDGGIVAVHEGIGLVRLDRSSKLVWKRAMDAHHQVIATPDGELLVLGRRIHVVPRVDPERPIAEDTLDLYTQAGELRRSVSILRAFERSRFASVLERAKEWGDLFHTNSVQWLEAEPGSAAEPFVRGRVLVSIRELDLLALVELASESVVWTASGSWRAQHEATYLTNGHLLFFDNRGLGERSRVLEVDPRTLAVTWSYGERPGEAFYSKECGVVQRLANGNTLVTESDAGRAFELTSDGRIVWEFTSPWRTGEGDRLVATLFEVRRLPRGELGAWLPLVSP